MRGITVTERHVRDPKLLTDLLRQMVDQDWSLLADLGDLRTRVSDVSGSSITEEERKLLRSLSLGSTDSPVAGQPAVAPEVGTLPPASTTIPGALVIFGGILYRFDGPTRSWLDVGAVVPANMMTTDTNQTPGAAVVKTWTAQQVFNGGLLSGSQVHVTTGGILVDAGQVLLPTQGSVRATRTVVTALADSTVTPVTFPSEDFDRGGWHDNAVNPSRLTVPAGYGGHCTMLGRVAFQASAAGIRSVQIFLNGVTQLAIVTLLSAGAGASTDLLIASDYILADGDYVELLAYQDSGGPLNITGWFSAKLNG